MTVETFTPPDHAIGYELHLPEGKIENITRLSAVRERCVALGLTPLDVRVFRALKKEDGGYVAKIMFMHEYAFKTIQFERVSEFEISREAWSWEPPSINDSVDVMVDEDNRVNYTLNVSMDYPWYKVWWFRMCEIFSFFKAI